MERGLNKVKLIIKLKNGEEVNLENVEEINIKHENEKEIILKCGSEFKGINIYNKAKYIFKYLSEGKDFFNLFCIDGAEILYVDINILPF